MENDKKTDKVVMENLTLMLNSIEEQKKIIKAEQEKKQKALNDAIENAKKLNEKEMQRHQLGHYKKDIIDNFNKLRKNISLLNEETKDECFKQLMDFYTELKAMNNPIIINAIISPFMSVFVYYHFKLGLLQFKFLEKDEQIENRYNDLQLKVFLIDIAKTLQGGDYDSNDVSIRFTKDMLFPERLPSFENFLTKSQHDRLIKMAETILNEQKEKFLDNYETTEDKEIALLHLHAIKKGDLPCGYMNENLYETPKKTVYFIQMISPKNSEVFEKTIEKEQFDYVIEVAKERLESIEEVLKQRKNKKLTKEEQEEYDHVKSIAEGKLPFGKCFLLFSVSHLNRSAIVGRYFFVSQKSVMLNRYIMSFKKYNFIIYL